MNRILLLIVDDQTVVREALRALLQIQPDIEIVGEAQNGPDAIRIAKERKPNVVLLEMLLPGLNGCDTARQINAILPTSRILFLTFCQSDYYEGLAIEAGASGLLSKRALPEELTFALRTVHTGSLFFSPRCTKWLRDHGNERGNRRAFPEKLTARESEVLQLVGLGLPNKVIAVRMGISIKTVEKHRQGVMDKLNVHETAGLTQHAIARGLVDGRGSSVEPYSHPASESKI